MAITRRDIIKRAFYGSAATILPVGFPSRARAVDPVTVATVASSCIQVMKAFSKPGNGLQAMLQANSQKLDLVLNQLAAISQQITALQVEVNNLRGEFGDYLRGQFRDELITGIKGNSQRYELMIRSSKGDPTYFDNQAIRQNLSVVSQEIEDKRATLSVSRSQLSPEVAMILPLCLSLEISCQLYRDMPVSYSQETLNQYENWVRKIEGPGGLQDQINKFLIDHNKAVEKAGKTDVGKRLNIAKAKADSKESVAGEVFAPCTIFCVIPIKGMPKRYVIPPHADYENLKAFCPVSYGKELSISSQMEENLNINKLVIEESSFERKLPSKSDVCEIIVDYNRKMSAGIRAYTNDALHKKSKNRLKTYDHDIATFKKLVAEINHLRFRIGFAVKAQQILANVRLQIRENHELMASL